MAGGSDKPSRGCTGRTSEMRTLLASLKCGEGNGGLMVWVVRWCVLRSVNC